MARMGNETVLFGVQFKMLTYKQHCYAHHSITSESPWLQTGEFETE